MFVKHNTLEDLYHYAVKRVGRNLDDSQEAKAIVRLLFSHYLNVSRSAFMAEPNRRLSESDMLLIHHAVKRLEKGEPVQYIIGEVEFYGLTLKVSPDVLIPRPETEELVDKIVKSGIKPKRILDICSGSGCIALALKSVFPTAEVIGIDLSPAAVQMAKQNAHSNNLDVQFFEMDATKSFPGGEFDLMVCNPPYVPASEPLAKHVVDYEPALALFVPDKDVLSIAGPIAKNCLAHGSNNASVWFEFHESHIDMLANHMQTLGLNNVEIIFDLSNKRRYCVGLVALDLA
jgi:release factor glutamine methyltransferase